MGCFLKPAAAGRPLVYLVLLFMVAVFLQEESGKYSIEARPIPLPPQDDDQQGYSKQLFSTLGVVCKCCDGTASGVDDCTTSWTGSCSNLQCNPWKLYQ